MIKPQTNADKFFADVVDVMICVEQSSAGHACDLLVETGFNDFIYIDLGNNTTSGAYSIEALRDKLKEPDDYASSVRGLTFQGGPDRTTWYTLSLQELLEDWLFHCCFEYGPDIVARGVGVRYAD